MGSQPEPGLGWTICVQCTAFTPCFTERRYNSCCSLGCMDVWASNVLCEWVEGKQVSSVDHSVDESHLGIRYRKRELTMESWATLSAYVLQAEDLISSCSRCAQCSGVALGVAPGAVCSSQCATRLKSRYLLAGSTLLQDWTECANLGVQTNMQVFRLAPDSFVVHYQVL